MVDAPDLIYPELCYLYSDFCLSHIYFNYYI